jgi:hypothetical protein
VNKDKITQSNLTQALKESQTEKEEVLLARETRISLTFRDVERVAPKGLMKMLGKR